MNNLRYIALTAVLAVSASASAQRISVTQKQFAHMGDSVYVDLQIGLNKAEVRKNAFVLITPAIQKGGTTMELPAVIIDGKARHRAYRRLVALKRAPAGVSQEINAGNKKGPQTFAYSAAVPYEPWMKDADFSVREEQCECNGPLVSISYDKFTDRMQDLNPPVAPPVTEVRMNFDASFKIPSPEPVKMRSESGKAYLDFGKGQSAVNPAFGNNRTELEKIGTMIQNLKDDPNTTITQIVIDGYASPEGTYAGNLALSGKRAAALKEYLKNNYGVSEKLFRVAGKGEDWNTLTDMIEASDQPWKEQALTIVGGPDNFDSREKKLMDMQGGNPYRWILANMFPQLRRSDYDIKYSVLPFTVEEGKRTLETNPSLLSLNEMFLIATSYEPGSEEFNRVFDVAARTYPGSDIANLNAAAGALSIRDENAAQQYMGRVVNRDAAFENNAGLLAAMRGDYDEAAESFKKAAEAGNAEAVKNLAEIEKLNVTTNN